MDENYNQNEMDAFLAGREMERQPEIAGSPPGPEGDVLAGSMMAEKRKKKKFSGPYVLLLLLFLLVGLGAGFALGRTRSVPAKADGQGYDNSYLLKKAQQLEAYIDSYYMNEIDRKDAIDGALHGLVSGLGDPYSRYYTKDEYAGMMEDDSGEYRGIGIIVYKDLTTGYVVIEQVMKDEPAYQAGIQPGDMIVSVDGYKTVDMSLTETVKRIKGEESDIANLRLLRGNDEIEVKVKKSKIQNKTVSWEMGEDKIGKISVSSFIETTDEDFITAINALEKKGMKGLVIDLRDNGGGLVDTCLNMLSRIVPQGDLLVYLKDRDGKRSDCNSNSSKVLSLPIVILVNKNTASASEIFTGCLKDYGMAEVVGSKTYGKGIVQNVYSLGDGTGIQLTVCKYFTPKGVCIHETGIEPDIKMDYTAEEWKEAKLHPEKDSQMKKALDILDKKIQ